MSTLPKKYKKCNAAVNYMSKYFFSPVEPQPSLDDPRKLRVECIQINNDSCVSTKIHKFKT